MTFSTPPSDGPALMRALHQHTLRQRREATQAQYRHRLVTAAGIDPDQLSEQGQRILRWLCEWDDWTVGGLVEILTATRAAADVAGRDGRRRNRDRTTRNRDGER